MASSSFSALPGTRDLQPPDTHRMRALVDVFAEEATAAGFGLVVPPMFEDVGVFTRLGEASDVVSKELYDFRDKGDRHIALRPEHTASICRIFAEMKPILPWKVWYAGPNFRYDKPQKGRYRQFDQVGVEAIGSHDPDLDTEIVALGWRFFRRVGLGSVRLVLNSLGDRADRAAYGAALADYFDGHRSSLSEQAVATLATNPLRVLDSKRPQDAEIVAAAPAPTLSAEAAAAFERVQAGLAVLDVPFEVDPRLVRGLDYYTRTTFEYVADSLEAAQSAVGGGGRYDGLVADLGGPAEPGVGFAMGVDRTLLAADAEGVFGAPPSGPQAWVVATVDDTTGLELVEELRRAGVRADRAYDGRSMKAQMKAANRSGAAVAVIVGPDEADSGRAVVRPLQSDDPQATVDRSAVIDTVRSHLGSPVERIQP